MKTRIGGNNMPEFEWGFINTYNAVIVVLLLIPNIIYELKHKNEELPEYHNRVLVIVEQVGRYASMFLMLFPIGVVGFEFGYNPSDDFVLRLLLDIVLIAAYYIFWGMYVKKKTMTRSMFLAIVPALIFLFAGILLHHWFLVIAAVLFGIGHIYITFRSAKLQNL